MFIGYEQPSIWAQGNLFNFMSSSDFLTQAQIAALHRDTYTSILKGMLAHGGAKAFAVQRLGITPVYLSNLLDPDHPPPSPELAERIVKVLPLDGDQQADLLEHMLLAREARDQTRRAVERQSASGAEAVREVHAALRRAYDASILTNPYGSPGTAIAAVRDAGKLLLNQMNPLSAPLVFVETCLIVHAAQMALNRWDDALYLVNWAMAVLNHLDAADVPGEQEWFDHLRINVLYAKSMTLRNLNLPRQAAFSIERMLPLLRAVGMAEHNLWMRQVYREQISILAALPRFALSDVEGTADQARRFVEAGAGAGAEAYLLLIDRGLIEAWTRYGSSRSLRRAARHIRARLDELDRLPGVGLMQQAMFLRSVLRFFHRMGLRDEFAHCARLFKDIAARGGLKHQLDEFHREFGTPNHDASGSKSRAFLDETP